MIILDFKRFLPQGLVLNMVGQSCLISLFPNISFYVNCSHFVYYDIKYTYSRAI